MLIETVEILPEKFVPSVAKFYVQSSTIKTGTKLVTE